MAYNSDRSPGSGPPDWIDLIVQTPDGMAFQTDILTDVPMDYLLHEFLRAWKPAQTGPLRYTFHLGDSSAPVLKITDTLRDIGVSDHARLTLTCRPMSDSEPVILMIEDVDGQRFATAVLLNTLVGDLAKSFLENKPKDGQVVIEELDLAGMPARRLASDISLYMARVSDYTTLRIYRLPLVDAG